MHKPPVLREIPDLPDELKEAALNGEFVLFVGAGVSKLAGLPSWGELAYATLEDLVKARLLDYSELEQLEKLDPKIQLSIAEQIAIQNSIPFNPAKHLNQLSGSEKEIYHYLNRIGCACVTTNYDNFLSPRIISLDNSTPPTSIKRIVQTDELYAHHLNTPGTVIHLHGSIAEPSTIVITTKDYLSHYGNEQVRAFLDELFAKKVVLFIGYGLNETELLEYILRTGRMLNSKVRRLFALHGYFKNQERLYNYLYEYYLESFGVSIIGFIRDYNNYGQLEAIAKNWSELIKVQPPSLVEDLNYMDEVLGDA